MYDPKSVAHEIRYPWPAHSKKWCDARGLSPNDFVRTYRANFITIWHNDPERTGTGNRTDDSCGWFDRTPGPYSDAVAYLLADQTFMHDVKLALDRHDLTTAPFYEGISEAPIRYNRLSAADTLAVVWMVAQSLELRRWWNGQNGKRGAHGSPWFRRAFMRRRSIVEVAADLALDPLDNLSSVDTPERMVRLTAAALNRRFRPWWRHPRWHVHHWSFQVHPLQQLRRYLFDRCSGCGKGFAYGESPVSNGASRESGQQKLWHMNCHSSATLAPSAASGEWDASTKRA